MSAFASSLTLEKKSSSSTLEKPCHTAAELTGTHKVKYHAGEEWDFAVEATSKPVDISLAMPHYRARHQPVDHRMSMFIGNDSGSVKAKVCRQLTQSRFYLEVQGGSSEVTLWLPSDFKGYIYHSGTASFSDGFLNRIMRNAVINEEVFDNIVLDSVVVSTTGRIVFRMWDVDTCAPENRRKEAWKKMFGGARRAPGSAIDWDYLLED